MAQYIQIYMDSEEKFFSNRGLYDIIVFIGEKQYEGNGRASVKDAYKRGKKVIDSKLHKWHKTTIQRLVFAKGLKYAFNYEKKTNKAIWKIHRSKAKKVFQIIYDILKEYKDPGVFLLFEKICKDYGFSTGAEAAGDPYYGVIKDEFALKAQGIKEEDFKYLEKCTEKIEMFSKFYCR